MMTEKEIIKKLREVVLPQEFKTVPLAQIKKQVRGLLHYDNAYLRQNFPHKLETWSDEDWWSWWGETIDLSNWEAIRQRQWRQNQLKRYRFANQKTKYGLAEIVKKAISQKRGDSSGITIVKDGSLTSTDWAITKKYPYIFIWSQDMNESTM